MSICVGREIDMAEGSLCVDSAWGGLAGPEARSRRVLALLVCVIVLSAADLYLTTAHLHSTGMAEGNPIARAIIATNSPVLLSLWKGVTVGVGVWILFAARRLPAGEAGAWLCFGVLCWLMVRWMTYSDEVVGLTAHMAQLPELSGGRWVAFTPDP